MTFRKTNIGLNRFLLPGLIPYVYKVRETVNRNSNFYSFDRRLNTKSERISIICTEFEGSRKSGSPYLTFILKIRTCRNSQDLILLK